MSRTIRWSVTVAALAAALGWAATGGSPESPPLPGPSVQPERVAPAPVLQPVDGQQAHADNPALVVDATGARLRPQSFSPEEALGLFGSATSSSAAADLKPPPHTPTRLSEVAESVRKLRAQGAGDDEIYRMRARALSAQTADALAAMDREQSAWDARLVAYKQERNTLLEGGQAGASRETQQAAVQRLRDTRFSPEELQRLAAYESDDGPQLQLP